LERAKGGGVNARNPRDVPRGLKNSIAKLMPAIYAPVVARRMVTD
jgi:hypothetical protein